MRIHLVSNPSHLEAVDPVALGRVRAKQQRLGAGGERRVIPILLHGDAAFAGQGIVAETLNLAHLEGYSVGGTVHVVVNNLIGFTTEPAHLHSSRFATSIAKRLPIPIFHVNGEDLEAVVRVGRLALEYRYAFGDDVVVDLIGYRRHGHSEVDDPTVTQPRLYREIADHPPLWQIYAEDAGFSEEECAAKIAEIKKELDAEYEQAGKMEKKPALARLPDYWDRYRGGRWDPALEVETAVAAERLGKIAARADHRAGWLPRPPEGGQARWSSARRWGGASARSTTGWPRRWPSGRCWPTASRCACRARTAAAARSTSATRC